MGKTNTDATIRPFTLDDTGAVAQIDEKARGKDARPANVWQSYCLHAIENGGVSLVIEYDRKVVGFLTSPPVPGMPGYHNLMGNILPEYRRRGFSSKLIQETLRRLSQAGPGSRRVIIRSDNDDVPLIKLLEKNGFLLQHAELHLVLDSLDKIPAVTLPPGFRRRPFKRGEDENQFVRFHQLAFEDQARFQPYAVEDVVAEENENFRDDDIFLLETEAGEPAGFVWSIIHDSSVQIEPLGVSPNWRGQGLGRWLLYAGLDHGRQRGASRGELWTADDNAISLNLYLKTGFKIVGGYAYYYVDLN